MDRMLEPELMDDADQARAYAEADFEEPNRMFVELFRWVSVKITLRVGVINSNLSPTLKRFFTSTTRSLPSCSSNSPTNNCWRETELPVA